MPTKAKSRKAKVAKPPPAPTANVNPEDPVAAYRQRAIEQAKHYHADNWQKAIEDAKRYHADNGRVLTEAARRVHREHDLLSLMTWAHLADFAGIWFIRYAGMVAGAQPPLNIKGMDVIEGQSQNVWPWLKREIFRMSAIFESEQESLAHQDAGLKLIVGGCMRGGSGDEYRAISKLVRDYEQRDPGCVNRLLAALHKRFPTAAVELPRPSGDGRSARCRPRLGSVEKRDTMSDFKPTLEDFRLFKKIAGHIHRHPELYQGGGAWLDEAYHVADCPRRDKVLRFTQLGEPGGRYILSFVRDEKAPYAQPADGEDLLNLAQSFGFDGKLLPEPPEGLSQIASAFTAAVLNLVNDHERTGVLTWEYASRVLLLVWVATDPTADTFPTLITGFQQWPWEGEREGRSPRMWASDYFDDHTWSQLIDLAHVAWENRPGDGPGAASEVEVKPKDLIAQAKAAELVRCSDRTIQRCIDAGFLRGYGPKGARKVSRSQVEAKAEQIRDGSWKQQVERSN